MLYKDATDFWGRTGVGGDGGERENVCDKRHKNNVNNTCLLEISIN